LSFGDQITTRRKTRIPNRGRWGSLGLPRQAHHDNWDLKRGQTELVSLVRQFVSEKELSLRIKSWKDVFGRKRRTRWFTVSLTIVVVVVVVVNGSYSAAPYSSPDRECITKSQLIKIKIYPAEKALHDQWPPPANVSTAASSSFS